MIDQPTGISPARVSIPSKRGLHPDEADEAADRQANLVSIPSKRGLHPDAIRAGKQAHRGRGSQSPQNGAFIPTSRDQYEAARHSRLNPLKTGPSSRRKCLVLGISLSLLSQSPQNGAFIPTTAQRTRTVLQQTVSIPSKRGLHPDEKDGMKTSSFKLSQSPQNGAFIPTL